jgi:hypothetical protein
MNSREKDRDLLRARRDALEKLTERGYLPAVSHRDLYGGASDIKMSLDFPLRDRDSVVFSKPIPRRKILEALFDKRRLEFSVANVIIPERKVAEGLLIKSTSLIWTEIVKQVTDDWETAYEIPPDKWEEIIAGAYSKAGFDEVILTLGQEIMVET